MDSIVCDWVIWTKCPQVRSKAEQRERKKWKLKRQTLHHIRAKHRNIYNFITCLFLTKQVQNVMWIATPKRFPLKKWSIFFQEQSQVMELKSNQMTYMSGKYKSWPRMYLEIHHQAQHPLVRCLYWSCPYQYARPAAVNAAVQCHCLYCPESSGVQFESGFLQLFAVKKTY